MKLPGLSGKDSVNLWPFEQVIWLQVFFSVKVVLIIGSSSFVRIHEHFCGKCWKGDVFFLQHYEVLQEGREGWSVGLLLPGAGGSDNE